jgi:Flp pilus assembly protein TadD
MTDDGKKTLLVCVGLAFAVIVAFEGVRKNAFVNYDDNSYISDNPQVQNGLNLNSLAWAFTTIHTGYWHPLTWVSHIIDCSVFGLKPAGHHIVSVGFHITNVILLFLVLKAMTGAFWPSAFAAALFGLHPLSVESVAWVAERKNVLSTFFAFLILWSYLWYSRKPGLGRYALVAVLFVAGLLSKPMLVTLPFVLMLLDYWPLNRLNSKFSILSSFYEKLPMLAMSAIICAVTYISQARYGVMTDIVYLPLDIRIGNVFLSYAKYIGKFFYPYSLAVLYPFDLKGPVIWQVFISALLLLIVTAIVIRAGQRHRFLVTGWFWYLGTLVPVIGFVQVGPQSMADRYMYLPGTGICIIVAWLIWGIAAGKRILRTVASIACVLVLGVLLITTRTQVGYWKNSLSLCEHALALTENNYIMHTNFGTSLLRDGRTEEAIEHFKSALAICPTYVEARDDLGCALQQKGLDAEAVVEFEKALQLKPNNAKARNNYGYTLAKLGRFDEAIEQFRRALEIAPDLSNALTNMCMTAIKAGKTGEVLEIIRSWQKKMPDNPELRYWEEQLEQHQRTK